MHAFVDEPDDALELLAAHDRAHVARFIKRSPDLVTGARDNVEDALRQMLLAEAGECERGERRVLRRLQDDGVPGDERRRDLPRADEDRNVPRHDRGDDAERLAPRVREHRLAERDRLALQLASQATEVPEDTGPRARPR